MISDLVIFAFSAAEKFSAAQFAAIRAIRVKPFLFEFNAKAPRRKDAGGRIRRKSSRIEALKQRLGFRNQIVTERGSVRIQVTPFKPPHLRAFAPLR